MTTKSETRRDNLEYGLLRPSWWHFAGKPWFDWNERKRRRIVGKRAKMSRKANRPK